MVRARICGTVLFTMSVAAICSLAGCTPAAEDPQQDVLAALESASQDPGKLVTAQDANAVVSIEAAINGQDADAPPGPSVVVGDPIVWTAVVTNLDVAPLTEIAVSDDKLGVATCPATELAVGATMTCEITGTAVEGPIASIALVTAKMADATTTEATDPTNYLGIPQGPLACAVGGPYTAECQGASSAVQLDGAVASAPSGAILTYAWTSDCPGAAFDDAASLTPVLTIDTSAGCAVACKVTLTVSDGLGGSSACEADVAVADTQGPAFDVEPADLALDCGAADQEAQVQAWLAAVTATDGGCGGTTMTNDFTAIPDACGEPVTVTWTATDACDNSATVSAELEVVDEIAPVITLNGEATVTVECHVGTYTEEGALASDACDPALTEATVGGDVVDVNAVGTYVVTYDAADVCGNASEQVTRTVEVVDTTPPVITVKDAVGVWPPNHKYVEFKLSDLVSIEDACAGPVDIDAMGAIVSIYSDEPEDVGGNGDGNTTQDIVILGPSSFQVRAERQGGGDGRVYGITFALANATRNEATTTTVYLSVPHDQSGSAAVDSGAAAGHTVTP